MPASIDSAILRRFDAPDEVRTFEKGRYEIVHLKRMSLGRAIYEPGWRWSQHIGAKIGQQFCSTEHVGYVLAGAATAAFADGRIVEMHAGDAFYIAPEPHDSWVLGDSSYISLHMLGVSGYGKT
jgi:hypothetical protein